MQVNPQTSTKGVTGMTTSATALTLDAPNILLTFPSGEFAVREALTAVLSGLDFLSLDLEESGAVELVLAEVLNNVVEHAYGDETPGWIEVGCAHRPNGLHFLVRDEGRPLPDGILPIGQRPDISDVVDALPEGGFGWFLIQDLAKDVQYRRHDGLNLLSFRISVGIDHRVN